MLVLLKVVALILTINPFSGVFMTQALGSNEGFKEDALDLTDPIDLEKQLQMDKLSPQSNKNEDLPELSMMPSSLVSSVIFPLKDQSLSKATQESLSSKIAPRGKDKILLQEKDNASIDRVGNKAKVEQRWFDEDFTDDSWQGVLQEITNLERKKKVSDIIEKQREYDRRVNSRDRIGPEKFPDGFSGSPYPNRPRGGNHETLTSNTRGVEIRIQTEREEIQRELERAAENKKHIQQQIKLNRNHRISSWSPSNRYSEIDLGRKRLSNIPPSHEWGPEILPSPNNSWKDENRGSLDKKTKLYPPIDWWDKQRHKIKGPMDHIIFQEQASEQTPLYDNSWKRKEIREHPPRVGLLRLQAERREPFMGITNKNNEAKRREIKEFRRRRAERKGAPWFKGPRPQRNGQISLKEDLERRKEDTQSFQEKLWEESRVHTGDVETREKRLSQPSSFATRRWDGPNKFDDAIEIRRNKDRRHASGPLRFRRDFMSDRKSWLSSRPHREMIFETERGPEIIVRSPINTIVRHRNDRWRKNFETRKKEDEKRLRDVERYRTRQILNQNKRNRGHSDEYRFNEERYDWKQREGHNLNRRPDHWQRTEHFLHRQRHEQKQRRDRILNKERHNRKHRVEDFFNQNPGNRVKSSREGRKRNFKSNKPLILIFEEVAVPVPVKEYDHSKEKQRNQFHFHRPTRLPFGGSTGSNDPPPLIISDLYDHRAPDRDHSHFDRRPGRAELDSHEKIANIEEGFFVHDAVRGIPVHLGLSVAPIAAVVDPSVENHLSITSDVAAASEIERLNHAAAIADIKRIHNLQVADAVIKNHAQSNQAALVEAAELNRLKKFQEAVALSNINKHVNAVNNQAALVEAAELGRIKKLHEAVALSNINQHVDASRVKAVSDQVTLTEAAKQQAILSHSLLNEQLVATALTEDQVSKSQKIDFINLVLKHGLRKVLRQQFRQHLKTRAEQEAFIHKLQSRKEDLIQRLTLLKPYFTSPGSGSFIVPAFLPNIPAGAHLSHAQIAKLPKINLLPSTHLLSAGFHLPHEIATSLQNEIDVGYVEHILRLPEKVFQRVLHIPKQDFILTLFPRLYRETIKHLHINPENHYYPNVPHDDVVKEHHHHHIHVHQPAFDKNFSDQPHHSQVTQDALPETYHGYPQSHVIPPHSNSSYGYNKWTAQHSAYLNTGPKQHEIILPTSNYKIESNSDGIQLPLEESSYLSYDPTAFEYPDGHSSSHKPHSSEKIKFSSAPLNLNPDSFHPSGSEISKINVRIKGEIGHKAALPISSENSFKHVLPLSSELLGRFSPSHPFSKSEELLSFNVRRNDRFPLSEMSEDPFSITTSTAFSSSEHTLTTAQPFSTGSLSNLHPSTLKPRPVKQDFSLSLASFQPSLTTFTSTEPQVRTHSTTPRPTLITIANTIFTRPSTTREAFSENKKDKNGVISFTTGNPFSTEEIRPVVAVNPFQGFGDHVIQGIIEKTVRHQENAKNQERLPGTDSSDDDHIFSAFRKKKGNATNSAIILNQIRDTQNIFGRRRVSEQQKDRQSRQGRNFTATSPRKFFKFFHNPDESLTSSVPHSPPRGNQKQPLFRDFDLIDFHPNEARSRLPNVANKSPTPQRVKPSFIKTSPRSEKTNNPKDRQSLGFPSEGPGSTHAGFRFQGGPTAARSIAPSSAEQISGRSHSSSPVAPFKGSPVPQLKGLESIPNFLRDSPQCSGEGLIQKSFCLYPAGYRREIAESIIGKNRNEMLNIAQILSTIPAPKVDLNLVAKQIPNLDLSINCETDNREVQLSWSRDIIGSWLSIFQTQPFEQKITVTTCGNSAREKGCQPLLQPRPLLAFHPEDVTRKPYVMEFPLPVGCVFATSSRKSVPPSKPRVQ